MAWPHDTLFVVYCAGPHCNGADRAALQLARLGRPVKMMIGGMTGWADEGFAFELRRDGRGLTPAPGHGLTHAVGAGMREHERKVRALSVSCAPAVPQHKETLP